MNWIWMPIALLVLVTGCSSSAPDEAAVDDDELTMKRGLTCYSLDPCKFEHSLGYCAEKVLLARKKAAGTVSILRYSAIADVDWPDQKENLVNFKQSSTAWSGEWASGQVAVKFDANTKQYTGHLVEDGGVDFEIACTDDAVDPCTRAEKNGTYCGSNLVVDFARAGSLYTCKAGKTVAREVCPSSCGSLLDDIDGHDECRN